MAKLEEPRIVDRRASQLVGPFAMGLSDGQGISMYGFSEIVVCDWVINSDDWVRGKLVIPMSSKHRFIRGSVVAVLVSAWPCSFSGDAYQDPGWALDTWEAQVKSGSSEDRIEVVLNIAARGKGTAIGRLGYTWTAYVKDR
jgi:hypothetical protein